MAKREENKREELSISKPAGSREETPEGMEREILERVGPRFLFCGRRDARKSIFLTQKSYLGLQKPDAKERPSWFCCRWEPQPEEPQ